MPHEGEQVRADEKQWSVYFNQSAELNTQRWLNPREAAKVTDLLSEERDKFKPYVSGTSA